MRHAGIIQRRLAALFGLLVALLLAVAAVYISFSWRTVKQDKLAELSNLAELGAASAELFLQHYTERARMLADDIRTHGGIGSPALLREQLLRYQALDANLAAIYAFDLQGRVLAATVQEPTTPLPPRNADPVFQQDLAQALNSNAPFLGRARYGARVEDWILPVRMPVVDRRGKTQLVLSLVVPLSRQQALWQGVALPDRWAIGLLRDDGYLQTRYPLPPDAKAAFLERHTGVLLDKLEREGFPASGTVEGPGTFFEHDQTIVAFKRLERFPITAYLRMPATEIWVAWKKHIVVPGVLFGVPLLSIMLAGIWAVRQQRAREAERDAAERSLRMGEAALKRQTRLLEQSQRAAQIGAWELDIASGSLHWTAQTHRIHGTSPDTYTPTWDSAMRFFPPDSAAVLHTAFERAMRTGEPWDLELEMVTAANRRIWVRSTGTVERTHETPHKAWGSFQDITARRRSEEQIVRLAHYDELTGLPNRNLFASHLSHALMRATRSGQALALLFIDLDRFKNINDALGHDVGDEVLKTVGERFSHALRASDLLARLGGDEFVVIAEDVAQPETISALAAKLIAAVDRPIHVRGHEFTLTASLGISLFPNDGTDVQTLLKNADTAMYRAKEQGRNGFQFYSPHMGSANIDRLSLETQLKRAVQERNQFVLHYQPRVSLRDGRINGVEALVRWQHPVRGLVPPGEFIPLAEELGLISALGDWVLRAACAQAAAWRQAGHGLRVCVNISARQLHSATFLADLRACLADTSLEPYWLELEITESVMMQRTQHVAELLQSLGALGVGLSVDDFGTGYSSLAYLKRLQIDSLKIDRSFVGGIPSDEEDVAIVRAVIALARSLRLEVVAEGVEERAQLDFLRSEGCDAAQGYLIGKPMAAAQLEALMAAGHPLAGVVAGDLWTLPTDQHQSEALPS
jgi:diguanylate cyclase (GGDEF)-like protein